MAYNNERKTAVMDREAELHNSLITGRYAMLQDTEKDLEALWEQAKLDVQASVIAPEKPVEAPFFGHSRVESDLFNAATLDRTLERNLPDYRTAYAPAQEAVVTNQPQEEEFVFSLTNTAKKAIAIFASAATIMLTLIGVNTHLINSREAEIRALEESNASRRSAITKIEERIAREGSEDEIRRWADENGLIQK